MSWMALEILIFHLICESPNLEQSCAAQGLSGEQSKESDFTLSERGYQVHQIPISDTLSCQLFAICIIYIFLHIAMHPST